MDMWSWLWIGYVAVVVAGFFALEIPAYHDGIPGNTASEKIWYLLKAEGRLKRFRQLIRVLFLVACGVIVWAIIHFSSGGWV